MTTERRRGRVHDAEGAREAILDAAEEVFAEHGFDGARVDAIAAAANYNKSLILHYFGDKFGLYTAVVKRIKGQVEGEIGSVLQFASPEAATRALKNRETFRAFLELAIRTSFDFLQRHPRVLRIVTWEAAEGWQTFSAFATDFDIEGFANFRAVIAEAQSRGLIRPDLDMVIFFAIGLGMSQFYLSSIPRYQILLKDQELSTPEALQWAREQIVDFVIHGTINTTGGRATSAEASNGDTQFYESKTATS